MQASSLPLLTSDVRWLQSGGFSDVFVAYGSVYKIFNRPLSERREFAIAKYLMKKYSEGFELPHVVKYYGYGHAPKQQVLNLYSHCIKNGGEKLDLNKLIHSFTFYDSIPFICMEYIDGIDGLEYGKQRGWLDIKESTDLMYDLFIALEELHRTGLMHRDVKPDNFIVYKKPNSKKSHLKLVDLGLATRINEEFPIYASNIGTRHYMSPEAKDGWHIPASDLYSAAKSIDALMGCPTYDECSHSPAAIEFYTFLIRLTHLLPYQRGTVAESILRLKQIQSMLRTMEEDNIRDYIVLPEALPFDEDTQSCKSSLVDSKDGVASMVDATLRKISDEKAAFDVTVSKSPLPTAISEVSSGPKMPHSRNISSVFRFNFIPRFYRWKRK